MKKSLQKKYAVLLVLTAMVGLLSAGCGGGEQTGSRTHTIKWISINSGDIVKRQASTDVVLLDISFQSDAAPGYVNKDFKEIEMVSTNPQVAEGSIYLCGYSTDRSSATTNADLSDEEKKKIFRIIGARVDIKSGGTAEIYAQTKDGTVMSNKITVTNGIPGEESVSSVSSRNPNDNYITQLTVNEGTQQLWMDSDESQRQVSLSYKSPYYEDISTIVWVVADPSVASMEYVYENYQRRWTIKVKGTGETEFYAQTPDGSVVSNKVKLSVGNRYNKQEAARNDIEEMVFKKLKYNSVQKDRLEKLRPYYFLPNVWYHRGQLKAIYSSYTDLSTVESSSIEFSGQDATIRGSAKTFNDNAIGVTLNFVIRLHYSDDFTQYTVVSEAYDMPELIRANIG